MVVAKVKDPINAILRQIEESFALKHHQTIKCTGLFIVDHYEVETSYTVEESLGDLMNVQVHAHLHSYQNGHSPHK
jgi:hypothetical protein